MFVCTTQSINKACNILNHNPNVKNWNFISYLIYEIIAFKNIVMQKPRLLVYNLEITSIPANTIG